MQPFLGMPDSYTSASLRGFTGDKRKAVAEQRLVVVFACDPATPISAI
jgi:hypothetical protein